MLKSDAGQEALENAFTICFRRLIDPCTHKEVDILFTIKLKSVALKNPCKCLFRQTLSVVSSWKRRMCKMMMSDYCSLMSRSCREKG